jgi:hypothetical protein
MRSILVVPALVLVAFSVCAGSDAARVDGATLGFLHDASAGRVLPIMGVPGAAGMGVPIASRMRFQAVVATPGYMLAADSGSRLFLFRGRIPADPVKVEGVTVRADAILASPNGVVAMLVDGVRRSAQPITGLPDDPVAGRQIDLASLPEPFRILAIDDTGSDLLVSAGVGETKALVVVRAGAVRMLLPNVDVAAASFFHGSSAAAVADRRSGAVLHLLDVWSSGAVIALSRGQDGLSQPAALAVAADNRRVFVVDGSSGTVTAFPLEGGAPASFECGCPAARLEPLRGNAVFRLTDAVEGLIWVFDGDGTEGRFVFIPAGTSRTGLPEGGVR